MDCIIAWYWNLLHPALSRQCLYLRIRYGLERQISTTDRSLICDIYCDNCSNHVNPPEIRFPSSDPSLHLTSLVHTRNRHTKQMREVAIRTVEEVRDSSKQQTDSTLMAPEVEICGREIAGGFAEKDDLACCLGAATAVVEVLWVLVDYSQRLVHTQRSHAERNLVPLGTILAETDEQACAELRTVDDAILPLLQVWDCRFDPYFDFVARHACIFGEAHELAVLTRIGSEDFVFRGGTGIEVDSLLEIRPVDPGRLAGRPVFEKFDGAGEFGGVAEVLAELLVLRGAVGGGARFIVAVVFQEWTARPRYGLVGLGLLGFVSFCLIGVRALQRRQSDLTALFAVGK